MRLYGGSAARRLSQCKGLPNTRSGARKVRAPGKDPLMLLGLLGEFLVVFFGFLLHPGLLFRFRRRGRSVSVRALGTI